MDNDPLPAQEAYMKREINRAINEALSGIYDDWCLDRKSVV